MPPGYQGYQDPTKINQMYGYAGGLTKGGMRDEPITSPWQGVRMMSDALGGNLMRNQAGHLAQQNRNMDASGTMGVAQPPGMPPSQSPGSFGTPTPPQQMTHPTPMPTPPPSPPPQMGSAPPVPSPGITGSGMPGQNMSSGVQPQMGGMGQNPGMPQMGGMGQNPMMSALFSPPPGGGMQTMGMG